MNTSSLMTSSEWLSLATVKLKEKDIQSARLDAFLVLEEILKLPRIKLLSNPDIKLTKDQTTKLNTLLIRRLNHEPMAYIRGHVEFYGHDFMTNSNVLIPRPESEAFIDLIKGLEEINYMSVADIGCGSGCLGITAKLEIPSLLVDLYDTSSKALAVAKKNATIFNLSFNYIESNLLDNLSRDYSIFLVNLPYLPTSMESRKNLSFEPPLALFSGLTGLDLYKIFWQQVNSLANRPMYILCESLENQHSEMVNFATKSSYALKNKLGLVQLFGLV